LLLGILNRFWLLTTFWLRPALPLIDLLNYINHPFQTFLNEFTLLQKLLNSYLWFVVKVIPGDGEASLNELVIWQSFKVGGDFQNSLIKLWTILREGEMKYLKKKWDRLVFYFFLSRCVSATFYFCNDSHVSIQLFESLYAILELSKASHLKFTLNRCL